MSHYGYSDHKTTAGNFAAKAAYFEKKLAELHALREKRVELGASAKVSQELIAAEIAAIDAKISEIVGQVEQGEQGTGLRDDYYSRSGNDTLASGITGGMAEKLRLGNQAQAGDYMALFRGINPRTGELFVPPARAKQIQTAIEKAEIKRQKSDAGDKKGDRLTRAQRREAQKKEKAVNLGLSSCVSLQKSISMAWAVSTNEERKEIERVFMEAVREALKYEEDQGYIGTRVGGLHGVGTEFVKGQGMALIYLHCTSRLAPGAKYPDAQLHIHIERPNFVILPDGTIQTLDARELFARQREFGAVVDVILYEKLKKVRPDLAAAIVFDRAGHGMRLNERSVSREEVEANSKRNQQINKETKKLARDGAAARQAVATRTATFAGAKSVEIGQGLDQHWRETIGDIEFHASTAEELTMPSLLEVQQMLFAGSSAIKQSDIDRVAAQLLAGNGGVERLAQVKNAIIREIGLIEIPGAVDPEGNRIPPRFTTQEMIDIESDCLKAVYAGLDDQRWTLPRSAIVDAIEQHQNEKRATQKRGAKPFTLTDEQREAAFKLTGDGQFKYLVGAAGVGKSATIAPVYIAYKNAGFNVIGVAPQNKQATGLTESTGMPAQTVHSLLINHELGMQAEMAGKKAKPGQLIPPGSVIICDEAGTLDTYTMQALMRVCNQRQAMLIKAGDRNQHGAVPTASMFGTLHEAVGDRVATIEKISRQTEEFQPIAQALYEGRTDFALDRMEEKDQLLVFAEHINEADALVADLLSDLPSNEKGWAGILVLADTNDQVRALNEKIRDARIALGELSSEPNDNVSIETFVNGRRELIDVAVGDRLLLRKNAADAENLKVYNGDIGTVLSFERVTKEVDGRTIEDTKFSILRDDGKIATIWASEYQAIQWGYSMTSTRSQGMTVWQAYYLPGSTATLQSLYVSYTRGIHGAKIYLNESRLVDFYKSVEKYRYKETALSLMPERRAAIQANAQNKAPLIFTNQSKTVLERIEGTSVPFTMPSLSEAKSLPSKAQPTHKFDVIPDTPEDRELAAAYGKAVIPLSDFDASSEQLKNRRIALVQTSNTDVVPTHNAELHQPEPLNMPALDERPHAANVILNLQSKFKPLRVRAKSIPKLKEFHHERLAAADSRRGTENGPGRTDDRRDAEPARISTGFGIRKPISRGLGKIQPAPVFTPESADYQLSYVRAAAGRRPPENVLQRLSARSLAENRERNKGVLQGNVFLAGRAVPELRRPVPAAKGLVVNRFDKQADKDLIANLKIMADLPGYAEKLGMHLDKKASYEGHQVYRYGGGKFDIYRAADSTWRWQERHSAQNGDIFKLHMEVKGGSFAEAKQAIADFHGVGVTVTKEQLAESTQRTMTELKTDALDRQAKIEAGTVKAQRSFGLMSRANASYLESRGISPEVLAQTRWKTNIYGSACFPHHDADRNFSGYEYRGFDYKDKATGENRQAKGFSRDTEKGIYIANRDCANPTEIRFSEGGVDVLSAYQLASPEERQRILFVGTTGEPGPKTEAAIAALAERHNIRRFSMAYDRDQGGDNLTAKRAARLAERFPDAQIEDVRERIGLQLGEDPNQLVQRLNALQSGHQLQGVTSSKIETNEVGRSSAGNDAPVAEGREPVQALNDRPGHISIPANESSQLQGKTFETIESTQAVTEQPEQSTEHETETRPRGRGI